MTENLLNSVKFKIGPSGVEFEASGDSDFIAREREKFNEMIPPVTRVMPFIHAEQISNSPIIEATNNEIPLIATKKKDEQYINFAHFNKEKGFNTDLDKVIGAAYYISEIKGINNFTREDILAEIKSAKLPALTNISDAIARCIKKVYLNENSEKIDGKRSFCIVQPGIEYCESYIAKDETVKKSTKSSSKSKPSKDYLSLTYTTDELNISNYCDIAKLSNYSEQILVLMYIYYNEKEQKTFTKDEVAQLLRQRFGVNPSDRQIKYFFDKAGSKLHKQGSSKNLSYTLMQPAIDEAKQIVAANLK